MQVPYQSILQVPTFTPRDQGKDYTNWLEMMKSTEGSRAELAGQKMDTLKGLLDRIPGFTDMMSSAQNLIGSALKGELTDTHRQVLEQQAAAQRVSQGVQGGAGAGINMSLASFGRAGLAAQQQALAQIPQFGAFAQNAFMGNIANDPSVTGPSWDSWSGQLQADTRDVYESKLAQAKALHQVQQLNEQFYVQEWQRQQAEARLDARHAQDRADMLAQSRVNRQNSAFQGYSSRGMVNPFSTPGRLSNSRLGGAPGVLSSGGQYRSSGGTFNLRSPRTTDTMRAQVSGGSLNLPGLGADMRGVTPAGAYSNDYGRTYNLSEPDIDNPFAGGMNFDNLY